MPKSKIDPVTFVTEAAEENNIADRLSDDQVKIIAREAIDEYKIDETSMADWRKGMDRGIKLAKLMKDDKNYPFPNASNVKYPLVSSAALQFNARAYPAIVQPGNVVLAKVFGADPQGLKAARGDRIAAHMSYQLKSHVIEWEEETDKLLLQLPIVGTMVRKVWYDGAQKRLRCKVVDAGDFIVNNRVKALDDAPRATEMLTLYPYEVTERVKSKTFLNVPLQEDEEDNDTQRPLKFIEQHRRIDLDGDGYEEPYIVTVHLESEKIVRVVADYDIQDISFETETQMVEQPMQDPMTGEVVMMPQPVEVPVGIDAIQSGSYFIPYHFWPSMDGGFWGAGLGLLLGDMSETINSILNMLMDAGHMSSLGGGFIGLDFKIKGSATRFKPGEWKHVNAQGQSVRDAMVPMTFPQPDPTLFALLGTLIEAGREIASVQDVMTGDSGKSQMTATATVALIEQGMMVFTAIYKRVFRSLRREFKLIAKINSETVSAEEYNAFHDDVDQQGMPIMYDPAQEYGSADMDIEPVADPQSVTKMQQAAKAQFLMQMAEAGLVNPQEVTTRMLEAMSIDDVEALLPQPDPMQQQMQQLQMQIEQAKMMLTQAQSQKAQAEAQKTASETGASEGTGISPLEVQQAQMEQQERAARLELDRQKLELEAHKLKVEEAKLRSQENTEATKIAATDAIKRAEIAERSRIEREKMQNAERMADKSAKAAAAPKDKSEGKDITALAKAIAAPKQVIRDKTGRITGVQTVKTGAD